VAGRVGLCRQHKVLNNLIVDCPKRILLSRAQDNVCDGNLYDQEDDPVSLCVEYPAPKALVNLAAWQKYFGFDQHGLQTRLSADFDPQELVLTLDVEGEVPPAVQVEAFLAEWAGQTPGPVKVERGRHTYRMIDSG
jgi:hypothetical protein